MTDQDLDGEDAGTALLGGRDYAPVGDYPAPGGRRRAKRRGLTGCLVLVVVFALIIVGGYYGLTRGVQALQDQFSDPADYPGPGTGEVLVEVQSGDTAADIARSLKADDVVASVDAFVAAANADPDSANIQVGFYSLMEQMRASEALAVLVDPSNIVSTPVTIPEGYRVGQIVSTVVDKSDLKENQLTRLLDDPSSIGLPAEADGNVEGYLYPATYPITPKTTARSLLREMVAKTASVEADLDVPDRAAALGMTPHQIITIASILEYEANNEADYAKVARVIYNRLDAGMPLQLDSTVSYVSKRTGDVWTTSAERNSTSLYNTYAHTGLPPGPIGSPGQASIEAALNPAVGDWLYFVPDFASGTTLFSSTYAEHLQNVAKAKEYCRTHDEC